MAVEACVLEAWRADTPAIGEEEGHKERERKMKFPIQKCCCS